MGYEWVGPAVQAGAGLLGEGLSAGDKAKQRALLERLLAEIQGMKVPELPTVQAEEMGPSSLESYQSDPSLVAAQRGVLARLKAMEEGGGFGIEDKADLARIGNQVAEQQKVAQSGLRNALARRGALGSGEDYASQMGMAQHANQQANQAGLDQSAMALRRRMQALTQQGSLAGDIRSQEFNEADRKAQAHDAIERYNASARTGANSHNAGLPGQRFDMGLQKAGYAATAANGVASNYGQGADDTRKLWAGLGRAGSEAARGFTTGSSGSALADMSDDELDREVRRRQRRYEPATGPDVEV